MLSLSNITREAFDMQRLDDTTVLSSSCLGWLIAREILPSTISQDFEGVAVNQGNSGQFRELNGTPGNAMGISTEYALSREFRGITGKPGIGMLWGDLGSEEAFQKKTRTAAA